MAGSLVSLLSTTWVWLGVGRKIGPVTGPGILPSATSTLERSTDEVCMVQVPGTGLPGSGHCVEIAGLTLLFQASGTAPNSAIKVWPRVLPQSSPGRPPLGHGMASSGLVSP